MLQPDLYLIYQGSVTAIDIKLIGNSGYSIHLPGDYFLYRLY